MRNKKAALVLAGGGALGVAHLGALKVLQANGYKFDFYAGVSAGAIISALLATGRSAEEIFKIIEQTNLFPLAFDFAWAGFGLVRGKKIIALLDQLFAGKEFKDLKVPLLIGATDFQTGERVTLNRGKIADAVRASLSVPVLFEPYFHPLEKRWLVDGGLTQNFPLDLAIAKYSGSRIIGIDTVSNFPRDIDFSQHGGSKIKALRKTLERTFRIMFYNQQLHFPADRRVIKISPDLHNFTPWDVFKLKGIFSQGEKAAKKVKGL